MTHVDPRARRHRLEAAPAVDALAAAVRLDMAAQTMRERQLAGGPEPLEDEPPTGLLDLAALRAALGAGPVGDVDPAAAAWLAGGPEPAAARMLDQVDALELPAPAPAPLTAASFAELVDPEPAPAYDPPPPAPVAPVRPAPPAPAPARAVLLPEVYEAERERFEPVPAFSSEHPRGSGWRSRHDPASRGFAVRDRLGAAPLQNVDLPIGPVLDQGVEGSCVGFGTADAANVLRLLAGRHDLLGADDAAAAYHRAQRLDTIPGENYSGTSVLAGMKAGVAAGWFAGYLWAFGTRDIASALGHGLPVVVGVPWLPGMSATGPGGLVRLEGADDGQGHCLAVVKLRLTGPQGQPGPFFGWVNSWGPSYGDHGIGWIHHRDLATLLHGTGEAAIPTATPR